MERERLLNVPNALTALRVALIIAFAAVHLALPGHRPLALGLLILAGITDFFDGWIARRFNQITWLGKLLDPLADKLMIMAALVCLMVSDVLPAWLVALTILKELYMVAGASLLFRRKVVVSSDMIGRVSTFLFVPAAILLYPWPDIPWVKAAGMVLMIVSLALSYAAAAHYTVFGVKKSRELKSD